MFRKTAHRGVTLFVRGDVHVARWTDPATGKRTQKTLHWLRSDTARSDWVIRKSWEIDAIRRAQSGGLDAVASSFADAVDAYLARLRLGARRDRTIAIYRSHLDVAAAWAARTQRGTLARWTRVDLAALGDFLTGLGGRAATVNSRLRSVRAFIRDAIARDMLPACQEHHVAVALKNRPESESLRTYIPRGEIRAVLDAARAADARPDRERDITGLVLFLLLSGMRTGECVQLTGRDVRLPERVSARDRGELRVTATATKTRRERAIDLAVSPALATIATALRAAAGDNGPLWRGLGPRRLQRTAIVMKRAFAGFSFQRLRMTCATFLTCAEGIFGAATVYRSAVQLGHSVQIAQKHYLGLERGIPRSAKTLEAAMGIEREAREIAESFSPWVS